MFSFDAIISTMMNKINYSKNFGGEKNALPKSWNFVDL